MYPYIFYMKFVLLVYMCIAGTCQTVYEQKLYETQALCQQSAAETKTYLTQKFPMSSGEIWCLTEEEFIKYQDAYSQTKGV
mgnify:CR=1